MFVEVSMTAYVDMISPYAGKTVTTILPAPPAPVDVPVAVPPPPPPSSPPPEQQKQKDEQDLENKVVEALGSAKWRIEQAPDVFALRAFCAALKDVGYEIRKKY